MGEPTLSAVHASAYTIPTDAPEGDGTMAWDATTLLVVEPVAGDVRGFGYSYTAAAAVPLVTGMLAGKLVGRNALDISGAHEAMNRALRNVGRAGLGSTALSALDIGLWDLKAKLLGQPLAQLLGRSRSRAPIYGSGGFTTYDDKQTAAQIRHWVEDLGCSRAKIKIAADWGAREDEDLRRTAFVRGELGPERELYVDANGGYQPAQAIRVAAKLMDHQVTWFEEPVSSEDETGLALVRAAVGLDVAAGEYVWSTADARRLLAAAAVDCLQLDVTRCGGVTGFLRVASLAEGYQLQVSGHCAPAAHAAVCAAVPNLRHVEFFHDHERIEAMLFDGVDAPSGGMLPAQCDRPGLGLSLRTADAERFRAA